MRGLLVLLLVVAIGCRSAAPQIKCLPTSVLVDRFERLRSADWRAIAGDFSAEWDATMHLSGDAIEARHEGKVIDGSCRCCESLIFTVLTSAHLEAVGVVESFSTYNEAAAFADTLATAAMGHAPRNQLASINPSSHHVSHGWTEPGRDTILDVFVSRRSDGSWLANIYWSRVYVGN